MKTVNINNKNRIDEVNNYKFNRQKAKIQTGMGCFFSVIIFGLLLIIVPIWLLFFHSDEKVLKVSHSPNHVNKIEVVKKNDFPDPTIRIKYDDKNIMKTTIPDTILVEWDNDFEAKVILIIQGQERNIVELKFK